MPPERTSIEQEHSQVDPVIFSDNAHWENRPLKSGFLRAVRGPSARERPIFVDFPGRFPVIWEFRTLRLVRSGLRRAPISFENKGKFRGFGTIWHTAVFTRIDETFCERGKTHSRGSAI
jgi:hypothetical protein